MAFNNPTTTIPGSGIDGPITGNTIETADSGQRITLNDADNPNGIAFYSGSVNETAPARSIPFSSGGGTQLGMRHEGATSGGVLVPATVDLLTDVPTGKTILNEEADQIGLFATDLLNLNSGSRFLLQGLEIVDSTVIQPQSVAWQALTRVNSWVDFAGSRLRAYKDAADVVHVNGLVASGTAALITTLASGSRPAQAHTFALVSAAAKNVLCAVQVDTTGAVTVVSNLASAQALLCLDFSFPALAGS